MEVPSTNEQLKNSEQTKPSPRPFSIEALMSDCVPTNKRIISPWTITSTPHSVYHIGRDTDSEASLDMELAQDLSRRSEKDGIFPNHFLSRPCN